MERFDVAVVGAGLAGLVCARTLARRGLRVLLIDRKRTPDAVVHTTGIFVRRTLEDFDLPADCLGPPVRRVVLYSPSRRPMALESGHDEFRVGRMGPLYRRLLDDFRRAGGEFSGSTRYCGTEPAVASSRPEGVPTPSAPERDRVHDCAPDREPIELQLRAGSLLHLSREGRHWSVVTRFLIGADGVLSSVAADLGLERNREWIVGIEKVYDLPRRAGPRTFHCFLDPKLAPGYLAWVCDDGGEAHVGLAGLPGRFDPAAALRAFMPVARSVVDLSDATLRERRGGRIPIGGVLGKIVCPRGMLIGDAAGAASPLTAGGLDPCLRLSSLGAQVAADFLSTGRESALSRYDGRRFRARFVSRLWMRRVFEALTSPWLLEAACFALRLPGLGKFARHIFFGRGSFPDVGSSEVVGSIGPADAVAGG